MPPGIVKGSGAKSGKGSKPISQMTTPIRTAGSGRASPAEPDGLRLCRLSKSPTHEGYGFGLREDSARKGYVVDHVDPDSPAQHGGLRQRDKIVEVNGIPVQGRTLKEIIDLIKKNPLKVDLRVSSREAEDASAGSKQQDPPTTASDRLILQLEDTSSGEIPVPAVSTRDHRGKPKKPVKPPVKPTAKGGKDGPVPVAGMSKAEAELRKKHKDARRESDTTSITTLEGSERKASVSRRRSSGTSQDIRGMYRESPWYPWDSDAYGGYFNPMTDAAGGYGWPPPDSWPSAPAPFPTPSCSPCASMLYPTGAYPPPYLPTPPSPYMPYQASAYWPSPYSAFMPTPFYGYGYPQWGMPYASYQGYAGYDQPGNGGSNERGSDAAADRPSTSKEGRRHGARRASNVSTTESADGARKSRTDKPDKKPPKDQPRKRL